ncbi:unnamed protein product [Closterium sp. Yama58-4]|nr:unnamed protein product [Closterium sp. Yama58-4]
MEPSANTPPDAVDMLPAPIWLRIFHLLHLPPSHPDDPVIRRRKGTPEHTELLMKGLYGDGYEPVVLRHEGLAASEQHAKNARIYGASCPLLCCALASKRLLNLVVEFSERQPISLRYSSQHPQWMHSVRFFLTRPLLRSLDLRFSDQQQLPELAPLIMRCSSVLTSLRLQQQSTKGWITIGAPQDWKLDFLDTCAQLQQLTLGRGLWVLNKECESAAWLKSVRCLTLDQVDFEHVSFQFLESITPQLHEFTLHQDRRLSGLPTSLTFSFSNARLLRFRFVESALNLTLTVPPSLKSFSAVANQLMLSCSSTVPLALDHLSLYGRELLIISSLHLVSVKVAYLDGPEDELGFLKRVAGRPRPYRYEVRPGEDWLPRGRSNFSWTEWLGTIAPTVEVLIVRHCLPIQKVNAEWTSLSSLGIVVHTLGPYGPTKEPTIDNWPVFEADHQYYCNLKDQFWDDDRISMPPSIHAPNLRFLFFPSSKACGAATLAALRQDYPALALYCVVDRSFYWHRKGVPVSNAPFEHVRQEKSGVLRCWHPKTQQPKNVREKMHSVNRKLVEGYCAEEDEEHAFKYNGWF